MPRARSPKRDESYKLWLESNGKIALKDIAVQLDVSESQIRKWKYEDKWDLPNSNVTKSKKGNAKSNVTKRKSKGVTSENKKTATEISAQLPAKKPTQSNLCGAPIGNKNALGNRGGKGGPIRNKHALKTREFETIFWTADIIDDEEKTLLNADYDKYILQYLLIDTLSIREKRIFRDIKNLKTTDGGVVLDSVTKNKAKTTTTYINRNKAGEAWEGNSISVIEDNSSHVEQSILKRIMELEEALTRVQGKKQRAIEVLHKMELDDGKFAIDQAKLQLYKQRTAGQIDIDDLIDGDDLGLDFEFDID